MDLTELSFADSSLMLDLLMLARRMHARGTHLRLLGAQAQVLTLIELLGLHRLQGIHLETQAAPA